MCVCVYIYIYIFLYLFIYRSRYTDMLTCLSIILCIFGFMGREVAFLREFSLESSTRDQIWILSTKDPDVHWTPHPLIVTIGDTSNYLVGSSYIPILPLLQGEGDEM